MPHYYIISSIWACFLSNMCICFVLYVIIITNVKQTYTLLYLPNLTIRNLFPYCVVCVTIYFHNYSTVHTGVCGHVVGLVYCH